jgi:cytochrome c oxidase cbb3-type subunit 3
MQAAEDQYGPLYEKYAGTDIKALAENPEAMKTGARLFSTYCSTCHGSDARGARGFPNLRDDDWLWGGEPDQIKTTILNGRIAVMPAWGQALGEDGVVQVAEYVRSLSGKEGGDSGVLAAGKKHFDTFCVSCHGAEGKGNPMLGAPNLTDGTWLYGGSQRMVAETLSNGRTGQMPAHAAFLGDERVHLLAAYVYGLKE